MAGDITPNIQSAASKIQRTERKFVAGVAVEIKTVLSSLSGTLKKFGEITGAKFEDVDLVFNGVAKELKGYVDDLISKQKINDLQVINSRLTEVNSNKDNILTGTPDKPGIIAFSKLNSTNRMKDAKAQITRIQIPMERPRQTIASASTPIPVPIKNGSPVSEIEDVKATEAVKPFAVVHAAIAHALTELKGKPEYPDRYASIIFTGIDPKGTV